MAHFNRVLRFDPADRTIEVEAGMNLGELLGLTAKKGLYLPVQPGYPAITVGGCIAANVHGKNPAKQAAFVNYVADLNIFHPVCGISRINRQNNPLLFDMTCGGYGLTGVILSATLKLEPFPGALLSTKRTSVGSLAEGLGIIRESTGKGAHAYSWHDGAPVGRTFGRGFVFQGSYIADSPPTLDLCPPTRH